MAPRRHRSISNVNNSQKPPPPPQRTFTPAANQQRPMGMLPTVYQSNMKVLLRREPTITSIVDQFSHVCLYHHNGQKWEKHGYEGSMFLFEKSNYPTYGFYILNRMGTEDFVHGIYPEDDYEIVGEYLMCRFYDDFTHTRLAMGLPYPIPEESKEAFNRELASRVPPEERDKLREKEKGGRSTILGLWMFATDAREPLKEVLIRLHSYVKQNLPYPEKFHYGPGRPPPPNPHLRTSSRASVSATQENGDSDHATPTLKTVAGHSTLPPAASSVNGSTSELDKLFAKLMTPSPSTSTAPQPPPVKSVNDLFAQLGGESAASHHVPHVPLVPPTPDLPITGKALLDSMFASALSAPPPAPFASAQPLPPRPEEIVIVSPKPTSSALPQILNQDVISTLLGLSPDSRASSAAPSSAGSRRSAHQRYEGDNEYSEGDQTSEGGSTRGNLPRVAMGGELPSFAGKHQLSPDLDADSSIRVNGSRRIQGDVTPRPVPGGVRLPPTSPPQFQQRVTTPHTNGKVSNGQSTIAPSPGAASSSADARARTLVPFEANSDLWPYPRAPLDDRSFEQDDVVELDFNDTRALSDPAIFSSRLKDKKDKREKGRKGRKDKERDKAEIEKGWDLPVSAYAQGQPAYDLAATGPVAAAARVQSPAVRAAESPLQGKKAAVNGTNDHKHDNALDGTVAKEAIFAALSARQPQAAYLGRKDFVRELLTLIHTDAAFTESLWEAYLARLG